MFAIARLANRALFEVSPFALMGHGFEGVVATAGYHKHHMMQVTSDLERHLAGDCHTVQPWQLCSMAEAGIDATHKPEVCEGLASPCYSPCSAAR
jgi:hypothetical protein